MLVVLKCGRVGPRGTQRAGDQIDLPPVEAQTLIDAGQAEAVSDIECAMLEPPRQNAMLPKTRGRKNSQRY